jgi:hypothetical protein
MADRSKTEASSDPYTVESWTDNGSVNAGSNVPKCAEVKILSWAGFSVISRLDGDRWLRFLVADRGGAAAVPELAS